MNNGILTQSSSVIPMPYRLLGSPSIIPSIYGSSSEWHPDVASWMQRAKNNNGIFSYKTLLALQNFCNSIDSAGLRSRMLRVNLICGDNLNAALVPLYLSESTSSTTLGNATDTNLNFVSGDYAESAGLQGNASNKALDTGLNPSAAGITLTGHMSVYHAAFTLAANRAFMGVVSPSFGQIYLIATNESNSGLYETYYGGATVISASSRSDATHILLQRTATTSATLYANGGAIVSSSSSVTGGDPSRSIYIFARNQGAIANPTNMRCRGYSIGRTMTATQISTFYSIMTNFATDLGRTPA